ncbi:MAG: hypothetical protein AMXMBFR82_49060 [Candidatus Hydrogenedentota bacterium]
MNALPNQEPRDGRARKDAALSTFERRRAVYINRGGRALLLHLLENGSGTADDVRNAVTLPPEIDPACLGAVPGALARAGIIRRVGYCACERLERHAAPTSVWSMVDASKAWAWLADNPEPAIPDTGQGDLFGVSYP